MTALTGWKRLYSRCRNKWLPWVPVDQTQQVVMRALDVASLGTWQETADPRQHERLSAFAVERRDTLHANASFRETAEGAS